MRKILHFSIVLLLVLLTFQYAKAHVSKILVNQGTNGSLTGYVRSSHVSSECGIANSWIKISGVNYPLEQEFAGNIQSLSPTVFAVTGNYTKAVMGLFILHFQLLI